MYTSTAVLNDENERTGSCRLVLAPISATLLGREGGDFLTHFCLN